MSKQLISKFFIGLGFLILLAGVLAGVLIWHAQNQDTETWSWRYKITVNIETPEGIKSGSAVRQVEVVRKDITNERDKREHYSFKQNIAGEAVVIDLGARGVVFALTDWRDYKDAQNAFNIQRYSNVPTVPIGKSAPLTRDLPKMVTFSDMSDPKSVKLVYVNKLIQGEQYLVDHFAELFGDGVALKEISIEITDEPVTWGIEKILPAFNEKYWDWVKSLNYGDPRKIGFSNFKTGANR